MVAGWDQLTRQRGIAYTAYTGHTALVKVKQVKMLICSSRDLNYAIWAGSLECRSFLLVSSIQNTWIVYLFGFNRDRYTVCSTFDNCGIILYFIFSSYLISSLKFL